MTRKIKHILVVEDDAAIREQLEEILEENFRVEGAGNLSEAYDKLRRQEEYQAVILDLNIPPFIDSHDTGIYLLDKIRRGHPGTRIIVISANPSDRLRELVEDLGADFFEKPFSLDAILTRLDQFEDGP